MLFSDHKSASDGDDLSGDVAGFVADEIADEAGDLFRVGVTVHRHVSVEHGVGLFAELFHHVCVHNTRRDGVDADAAVGDFLREMELMLMMTPFCWASMCGSTARVQ